MEISDLFALTARLRRNQPRNPDVQAVCDELERRARQSEQVIVTAAVDTAKALSEGLKALKNAADRDQKERDAMKRGLGTTKLGKRRAKRLRK